MNLPPRTEDMVRMRGDPEEVVAFRWLTDMQTVAGQWRDRLVEKRGLGYDRVHQVYGWIIHLQGYFTDECRTRFAYSKAMLRLVLEHNRALQEADIRKTFKYYNHLGKTRDEIRADLQVFLGFLQWLKE